MKKELAKYHIELIRPGLVFIQVKDGVHIEKEDVIEVNKINLEWCGETGYFVVLCSGRHTTISDDAKELTANPLFSKKRLGFAMVVHSLPQRLVGNFFIKLNKPIAPAKVFNSKEDAFKWVEGLMTKHPVFNQ